MRSVYDKSITCSFRLSQFSPADLERVAGLTRVMQRDWRRRGFLPTMDGRATFDFIQIAQFWFMVHLAQRGLGPKSSQKAAALAARAVAEALLHLEGAVELPVKASASQIPAAFRKNRVVLRIWSRHRPLGRRTSS